MCIRDRSSGRCGSPSARLRTIHRDRVPRAHPTRNDDTRVQPPQPERPALGAVDEGHGAGAEAGDELLAAGVRGLGHLDHGSPLGRLRNHQSGAGGQVLEGQVQVDIQPVSYTHLDVYKRQVVGHLACAVTLGSRSSTEVVRWASAAAVPSTIGGGSVMSGDARGVAVNAAGAAPVSYTHLDVYKRQP